MSKTTIEWADYTFNPWIGCSKVSPGCANCYAEAQDKFRSWTPDGWGKGKPRKRTSEASWKQPLKWNRMAEQSGNRPRVFCASLADWLDDEAPIEWLADLLKLIHATPNLDWLLLTKRPENWERRLTAAMEWVCNTNQPAKKWWDAMRWICDWLNGQAPRNVWIGTSVEDQQRADERIPHLLQIPAKVRFLSCEPLLGPVDLRKWMELERRSFGPGAMCFPQVDWVICGGESGQNARPMDPNWACWLRDQCLGANVPFLFKQWGEFVPGYSFGGYPMVLENGQRFEVPEDINDPRVVYWKATDTDQEGSFYGSARVGKKAAGRLLDGQEWNQFPEVK